VVKVVGVTRVPNYPGEVQVRYLRRAPTAEDPDTYFIRQEYEGSTLRSERDIAAKAAGETLIITAASATEFQITTSFRTRWTGEAARTGTRQFSTVKLLNRRRD
jgi:hypothetical protein